MKRQRNITNFLMRLCHSFCVKLIQSKKKNINIIIYFNCIRKLKTNIYYLRTIITIE